MKPINLAPKHKGRRVLEKNLRPVSSDSLKFQAQVKRPRVHLSRASYCFERAALQQLEGGHAVEACELLMDGIRHDRYYQTKLGKRPSKLGKRPSTRLYDLLAGLAVRHNQQEKLKEIIGLIEERSVEDEPALKVRIEKWKSVDSKWYRRWQEKSKELNWSWTENGTAKKTVVVF
jgi:hypothetical protein